MTTSTIARLTRERSFTIILSLLISLGLLLPTGSFAADSEMSWIRMYKHGGSSDAAYATAVDTHGNALVGGRTYNYRPSKTPTGAFLRKYNSAGRLLWKRSLGSNFNIITGIAVAKNDFIYVVGSRSSSSGGANVFIRKYGKNGGILWTRNFGTRNADLVTDVAVYKNRIYVVGVTEGTLRNQTSKGDSDAFIRKYSARGRVHWTRQFGTAEGDGVESVAVDKRGYVYVATYTGGIMQQFEWDSFLRKYNADGRVRWTRQFGERPYRNWDLSVDSKRNVFVTGNKHDLSTGERTSLARKYTPGGKLKWHRSLADKSVSGSAIDRRDNIYVVGNDDNMDGFVSKYSRSGGHRWTRQIISEGSATDAAVSADNSLYVIGSIDNGRNWYLAKY